MANDQASIAEGYDDFLRDLKERIRSAQVRAVLAVNRELVLLYWLLGRDILTRINGIQAPHFRAALY